MLQIASMAKKRAKPPIRHTQPVRIRKDILKKLDRAAENQRRTLPMLVNMICEDWLAASHK